MQKHSEFSTEGFHLGNKSDAWSTMISHSINSSGTATFTQGLSSLCMHFIVYVAETIRRNNRITFMKQIILKFGNLTGRDVCHFRQIHFCVYQCCGSGMFIPDPVFWSRIQGWKDPGSASASKFSKIWSRMFILDLDFFSIRIQGSKKHRIRNTEAKSKVPDCR